MRERVRKVLDFLPLAKPRWESPRKSKEGEEWEEEKHRKKNCLRKLVEEEKLKEKKSIYMIVII